MNIWRIEWPGMSARYFPLCQALGKLLSHQVCPSLPTPLDQSIRPRGRGELKCACIVHNFGGLPLASIETKLAPAHREGVLCTLCSKIVHFIFTAFLSFFLKSMKFDMTVTSSLHLKADMS